MDHNPYQNGTGLVTDLHSGDWLEGWNEAKKYDDLITVLENRCTVEQDEKVEEFARLFNLAKERGLLAL